MILLIATQYGGQARPFTAYSRQGSRQAAPMNGWLILCIPTPFARVRLSRHLCKNPPCAPAFWLNRSCGRLRQAAVIFCGGLAAPHFVQIARTAQLRKSRKSRKQCSWRKQYKWRTPGQTRPHQPPDLATHCLAPRLGLQYLDDRHASHTAP